ncbi:MAG: hypothetical protein V8T36_00855 [Ruthenibacterium lactatiformans]
MKKIQKYSFTGASIRLLLLLFSNFPPCCFRAFSRRGTAMHRHYHTVSGVILQVPAVFAAHIVLYCWPYGFAVPGKPKKAEEST